MKNVLFLLIADIIWGAAFVAQRTGGDVVGAYSFNCIRSLIGFVVLLPFMLLFEKGNSKEELKKLIRGGIICGIALCFASNLQQLGINLGSSVGKAGFLTACYILLVPVFGLFLHKKCEWKVGLGVLIAVVGLYFLCMKEGAFLLEKSDVLLLLCAVSFAIQILAIDYFAPHCNPVSLSCVEFFVCGILSMIPSFFVDMHHSVSGIVEWSANLATWEVWIPLLYAGVCSSGIAYTFQIAGQKNFNPTIASLVMSLESAFSVLFGWLLLNEKLSAREAVGVVLVFVAIIVAQIPSRKKQENHV